MSKRWFFLSQTIQAESERINDILSLFLSFLNYDFSSYIYKLKIVYELKIFQTTLQILKKHYKLKK